MSIFGDIGKVFSDAADDIGSVIKTVAGDLENAVQIYENVLTGEIKGIGRVIVAEGTIIIDAITYGEQLWAKLIQNAIGVRPLRNDEKGLAQEVFRGSVPVDRVVISSLIGFGGAPFTVPGSLIGTLAFFIPGIGPLLAIEAALGHLFDKYIIFLGSDGYRSVLNKGPMGSTFIHEMTHVWQGHNQAFAWSYVGNSVACQCALGRTAAYRYTAGNQWNTYQAEPQAQIVQDWYEHWVDPKKYPLPPNGTALAPQLQGWSSQYNLANQAYQAYIDSNIRPGLPHAQTALPRSPLSNMHNTGALRKALVAPFGVKPVSSPAATTLMTRHILPKF